ncbi:hypothetical protein BH10PSE6_BH10PSE6_17490 [soil metagenome]
MNELLPDRPWPPLIHEGQMSRWMLVRDVVLTVLLWFLFALLAAGEVDRVAGHWFDELGVRAWFRRAGYNDLGNNWPYFLHKLAPYLGIALLLTISLVSFSIDTINRRARALRGRRPPRLPLGIEARHAEFATLTEHVGKTMRASRVELNEVQTVDARSLLLILGRLDEAALIDARQLKVTRVHVTEDGHYQILADA